MPLLRPPHLLVCKVCLNHQKTRNDVIKYARKSLMKYAYKFSTQLLTTNTINLTTKFIRKTRVHHFSPSLRSH